MKVILTVLLATFLAANNPNASIPRTTTNLKLAPTVYSGNCTLYKLTLVKPNKKKYTPVKTAFAKVVIDKSSKRFTFFFDGKQVGSWSSFDSYVDNQQGGEGFTMDYEWSAHRFTAERTFNIYNSGRSYGGELGYEYEITNYKVN
ncbi:hypothetical protein [Pedobacter nanyangensis]|uniref:hypothetical protein n=1 Tax=Pedobacter nanyangensis TaxID=1562389 RepID=UPI000DE3C805|nr:hypothetical protein [Pedobacter nanyangensis]